MLGVQAGWSFGRERDGTLHTLGVHAAYIREFARQVERVRLFAPVGPRMARHDAEVALPNVEVVPLPAYAGYAGAVRHLPAFLRVLRLRGADVDAWYCRVPDPFAWLPWMLYGRRGAPVLMHVVGDPLEALASASGRSGFLRAVLRCGFAPEWWLTCQAMRHTALAVNGETVYQRLRGLNPANSRAVVSSTLTEEDFHVRTDTCSGDVIRLLYVGFLRQAKGLEVLLRAFASLRSTDSRLRLILVGSPDPPTYEERLRSLASQLGVRDYVEFRGYVPPGPALRAAYREADIFVFPSLSEGSPRVVLEAMANSLPVVSTAVGSLPAMFQNREHLLMVPQGRPDELARAVSEMVNSPSLRRQCVDKGYAEASRRTLRGFVGDLIDPLKVGTASGPSRSAAGRAGL